MSTENKSCLVDESQALSHYVRKCLGLEDKVVQLSSEIEDLKGKIEALNTALNATLSKRDIVRIIEKSLYGGDVPLPVDFKNSNGSFSFSCDENDVSFISNQILAKVKFKSLKYHWTVCFRLVLILDFERGARDSYPNFRLEYTEPVSRNRKGSNQKRVVGSPSQEGSESKP